MARILVVDDDASMRDFLCALLRREGYDVDQQVNGVVAHEWLQDAQCPKYDLLLSDIVMPGMDGLELAQKAAPIQPDMKVMFITGFTAVSVGDHGGVTPHARILSKPFHLKDIALHVADILAESD